MSRNPYAQVALTYVRRPFSSVQAGFFTAIALAAGLFFILLVFSAFERVRVTMVVNPNETVTLRVPRMYEGDFTGIAAMSIVAAFFAGFLAMHVKEQFTESRSHLMPDFRRVHIAVAAVATLILAVVAPAILTWLTGLRSIGLVAITVFVFGAMFWSVLVLSNWIIWPILTMMLFSLSQSARHALVVLVSGQFEAPAVGLLALGATIIVLAGMRLFRLNEDMPEYHRRMPTGWAAKGRMTGQNVNYDGLMPRALVDWFRAQAMAHVTRHVQRAARSPWSRVCRWQLGMPTGWRVWLWGIPAILVQHFLAWHITHRMPSGSTTPMMVANSLAMLPMMLAATQSVGWLTLRMRTVDCELMLPVSRRAYVRQWSAAMALGHFQLWGAICVSTIAWWLLAAPTTPPWTYLASVAAVALLAQIGLFGVMSFAWIITGIRLLQISAFMACIFALMTLVMGGCDDIHFQLRPGTLPAAAGAAALGLLLSYLGYRRRLMADFD